MPTVEKNSESPKIEQNLTVRKKYIVMHRKLKKTKNSIAKGKSKGEKSEGFKLILSLKCRVTKPCGALDIKK